MIRTKVSDDAKFSFGYQRLGAKPVNGTITLQNPIAGNLQTIVDQRVAFQKTIMPAKTRRARKDPIGNIVIKRKGKTVKRGSRLQPFTMNPVLIQKIESKCGTMPVALPTVWGPGTVVLEPGVVFYDSAFVDLLKTNPEIVDAKTRERAIINCLAKLSSPKHLDLGVGIAEIHDTIRFLKSPLKSLVSLFNKHHSSTLEKLNKVKRHRRATTREFVDAATDTWLSYRYAFMPLAQDVTGLMCLASEKLSTDSRILRRVSGRGTVESTNLVPLTQTSLYFPGLTAIMLKGQLKIEVKQEVTAVQLYRYKPYFEDAIYLASLGLSPTQLLSTAWELIPFSFVADWGVGVGNWLRAWEPKPWIKLEGACISTKTTRTISVQDYQASNGEMWQFKYFIEPAKSTRVQLSRVLASLTPPSTPLISSSVLNLSRSLDSLSLLWKPISARLAKFR